MARLGGGEGSLSASSLNHERRRAVAAVTGFLAASPSGPPHVMEPKMSSAPESLTRRIS